MIKILYVDKNLKYILPVMTRWLNHGQYVIKSTDNPRDTIGQLDGIDLLLVGKGISSELDFIFEEWAPDFLPHQKLEEPHAGYRLLNYVKGKYPDIKIIVVTGYCNNLDEALSNGADGFLGKPFEQRELIEEIERVM